MPENKEESTNIEIKKVVITIAGKDLELTIGQAKELQDILNKTFPNNKEYNVIKIIEQKDYIPYPIYPSYPSWQIKWDYDGTVMCLLNSTNSTGNKEYNTNL